MIDGCHIIRGGGGGTRIFDLSGNNRFWLDCDRSYVCVERTEYRAVLPSRSKSFKNKLFRITHKCIMYILFTLNMVMELNLQTEIA